VTFASGGTGSPTMEVTSSFATSRNFAFNTGGTITVTSGNNLTVNGAASWSGTGGVTLTGPGEVTLAAGTYNYGPTTLTGGNGASGLATLAVNATGVQTNVTANGTSLLVGTGSIIGDITLNSGTSLGTGGAVSPGLDGLNAGTLAASTATLRHGAQFGMDITDASGGPLASSGTNWNKLAVSGALTLFDTTGAPADPFIVHLNSFDTPGNSGNAANFNPNNSYIWDFLTYGSLFGGFASSWFSVDSTGFTNSLAPNGGTFTVINDAANFALAVEYTPNAVPEPGSMILAGLAALGLAGSNLRRRRKTTTNQQTQSDEQGSV
jgi:hypothetical protein